MPFYVEKGDLVEMKVDAIVNAANVNLKMVEGVGRAIFHKAGDEELSAICKSIKRCDVGHAVATPSFNMTNTKMIIHAVAPIYINGKHGEEKNLISAYNEAFKIIDDNNFKSIAFPLLSGEFNYPLRYAYEVAYNTILKYLESHIDVDVYLVMYKNFPETIDDGFHEKLTNYITSSYKSNYEKKDISIAVNNLTFVKEVRKLQKNKNIDDKTLILKGNLSQILFDKIVNNPLYIPTKGVCLAFSIAMGLDEDETNKLLMSMGYRLEKSNLLDLIVSFYINEKLFDVYKCNNALFNYNLKPIGAAF